MGISIDVSKLDKALSDLMEEYGDVIYKVSNEALGAGEKILINSLKAASPEIKNAPDGYVKKRFKNNWKGTGKKYKLKRFVGNTTTVTSKKSDEIPLSNVLEYSTIRGKPFIIKTYESNVSAIANAIINEIKKGV